MLGAVKKEELIEIEHYFDDRDILLDCICNNRREIIDYMIDTCLSYAHSNNIDFTGFEITAE